ncbi:MAG TPA: TonB family protein [Pyrinomonadaceae bacterium]|nr:TonB family protein [Pyrinomonadaceae bacterium]
MKRSIIYTLTLMLLILFSAASTSQTVSAQQASAASNSAKPADIDKIIRAFAAKETEFRRALNEYAFKRDAVIQILGLGGQIAGEYHRVSEFTFDSTGNRYEKILFFPMPTYAGVTPEDIEDLGGVNPFALEASKIDQYNLTYVGKEKIDELDLYIFDVAPKVMPDPKKTKERFFKGRIWVDDRDLQIVKSRGKGVPETKDNKFPIVETYREQIDSRYWFPTYSYADDTLTFGNGEVLHLRMRVTYTNFVKGHATVTITEVGADDKDANPNTNPTPAQTPAQTPAPATPQSDEPLTGGVINNRAIEMPQPIYPDAAKQKHIHGTVKVDVVIDEKGNVISARATDGPKELREAAVEAAKKARFNPARLHGALIKQTGTLVYKFE